MERCMGEASPPRVVAKKKSQKLLCLDTFWVSCTQGGSEVSSVQSQVKNGLMSQVHFWQKVRELCGG